jgi:prepilin-type N-terminal cleavage/methylation domain-containing protein
MIHTRTKIAHCARRRVTAKSLGFTLIELMVSTAVFLIIGGAAISLFSQHAKLFNDQQGTVGLNITLRNALSQIENDTVQAGNGFYGALSVANTPIGVTITNNPGAFDSFYIIQASAPAAALDPGSACANTSIGGAVLAPNAAVTTGQFPANTEVLFMNGAGNQMTIAKLTGSVLAGGKVNLTYGTTGTDGRNGIANDIFGLTWNLPPANDPDQLSDTFCGANGDYVVPLSWVQYSVDAQNRLVRQNSANPGNLDYTADQIIGFKVGAATFQSTGGTTSTPDYNFNSGTYNPNLIRSIRVSVIGRTPPNKYSGTNFRNTFDGQNYKIQSLSLVINPRNLSMND